MSNHGVVAYGVDLHSAYMKMETVEHFAQIALVTHLLGRQQPLGSVELEKLMAARSKYQGSTSSAPLPLAVPCDGDGDCEHSPPRDRRPRQSAAVAAGDFAAPVSAGESPATTRQLLSSDSESHACPDVYSQGRVADDFLILLVEGIFEVHVAGDTRSHCIPSAEIDARIAGRVVDAVAEEVGIGTPVRQNFRPDWLPTGCSGKSATNVPECFGRRIKGWPGSRRGSKAKGCSRIWVEV